MLDHGQLQFPGDDGSDRPPLGSTERDSSELTCSVLRRWRNLRSARALDRRTQIESHSDRDPDEACERNQHRHPQQRDEAEEENVADLRLQHNAIIERHRNNGAPRRCLTILAGTGIQGTGRANNEDRRVWTGLRRGRLCRLPRPRWTRCRPFRRPELVIDSRLAMRLYGSV